MFNVHNGMRQSASLWATVITKLAEQTMKIKETKAIEKMANKLVTALYFDYDTSKSYADQLAHNMFYIIDVEN